MLNQYISVLALASKQAPIAKYAWGLVALAAAAAIIATMIGYSRLAIIAVSLVILGTALVMVLSQLIISASSNVITIAIVLIWSIVIFFIIFLMFTVSAFAFGQPCNWADFLQIRSACGRGGSGGGDSDTSKLVRVTVLGDEVSVFAGGPGEPNPGCQDRTAETCVVPKYGGKLVLGTQRFTVTKRIGGEDRASASELPYANEQRICYAAKVTTGACEERHLLEGYPSATEEYFTNANPKTS
ncbi:MULTISPECIES: DUF2207 domain-containing protein [Rhizobium]|uniref:Uncharacterized protein n=1 Tax=Rhizobium phaseoli TaxID=396 RepID=A0A7X6F885_9HYPH|nr:MULTISPECIES: DUF2207 domain-containing protein [Rhizobium]MDE8763650.1 DUF2207 domain-containing protein [Rhizobium sp. CBK13]NKF14862.1 DUF2207 domain-containing protein [Rhizobium phaseoli]QPK09191.1 hypothetical protein HER27_000990 [Rhizobium phaseoli]